MRKHFSVLLTAALLLGLTGCGTVPEAAVPETTTEAAETSAATVPQETTVPDPTEPEYWQTTAQEVTGLRVLLEGEDQTGRFTDRDRETRKLIEYGNLLRIESDQPFSALYLEWDAMPHPYQLVFEGGRLDCGSEGYQHDYIRLPQAVTWVEFALADRLEPVLCEVRAFTEGGAPEGIQDWRSPNRPADVLVFPTHSDDDALFFGALMSYYAIEMGLDIQTAFMTRHYDQPVRCHERLDGLWEVGVRRYPALSDAPDLYAESLEEARYLYAQYDILGWQIQQIRRFRPKVIVAHDLNGEYGHGGHRLNAHTLTEAIELAADPAEYPDSTETYGVWDTPKTYFHLYPENQIQIKVDQVLEKDPGGRTPFEIAEAAYGHHKSQHWCYFAVNRDDPEENCVQFGLYRSLVGPDTLGDLMDNIGYG